MWRHVYIAHAHGVVCRATSGLYAAVHAGHYIMVEVPVKTAGGCSMMCKDIQWFNFHSVSVR